MFVFTSNLRTMMKKRLLYILFCLASLEAYSDNLSTSAPTQTLAIFADFLYWHASEQTSSVWTYIPELPNISAPNVYFGWSPGVKAGFKYKLDNSVDTQIYWTHFATSAKEAVSAAPNQTLLPQFFNGFTTLTPFNSANVNWQVTMNLIDVEIGHRFDLLESLSVQPFIGVKGGAINQRINSTWNYQGELFEILPIAYGATEKVKNNFSGAGPSFGIDSKWKLYKNFNIRGEFSSAWMWGQWTMQDIYTGPSLSGLQLATIITTNTNNSLGSLMLRYFAGFDWTYESQASVTLKVGYEMQYWMNQLRLPLLQQVPVHSDLTLQGGTCGILIKF